MNNSQDEEHVYKITEKLPQRNVSVLVICLGFRFLGYLDEAGKWRTRHRDEEIGNVIAWSAWA